jgi:hypothetical protein
MTVREVHLAAKEKEALPISIDNGLSTPTRLATSAILMNFSATPR